jgi:hypothetical protein
MPAAAITAATFLLSAGSSSAAVHHARTAAVRQTPDVVVSWHKLHLINGWIDAPGPSFPVGNAAYSVINGVVYLTGGLKRPSGTNRVFAVLPKAARPVHYEYFSVISLGITSAVVSIYPSGQMRAYFGDAAGYTSLDGISYPAAGTRWHKLALTTHWKSAQTKYGSGDPAYTVRGGIVYLSGSASNGPDGSRVATLPPGARPKFTLFLRTYTFGGAVGTLAIRPDGAMFAFGPNSQSFLSLAGISFPYAKFKWHKLALSGGWHSDESVSGTGDPAYGVVGPIVYLGGSMSQTTGSIIFAATPAAIRPRHELNIEVFTAEDTYGQIQVTKPSLYVESMPASNAQGVTSLDGVSYPLSS